MKPLYLLAVGVVVGWAASGVDWNREAVGQESSPPAAAERPIRRGEGVLRGRLMRQTEAAAPALAPANDAPAFTPNDGATAVADAPKPEASPSMSNFITVPRQEVDSEGRTITVYEQHHAREAGRPSTSANPVGRFQVSAYGSPNGTGCYVVDSTTGQTWLIRNGQPPEVVTKALLGVASAPAVVAPTPVLFPPTAAPPQVQYGEPTPQNAN
ncbi:hypothetical protein [Lacipirellula parvula]|nr:hypothetical protein [Lacipirellula parvula]